MHGCHLLLANVALVTLVVVNGSADDEAAYGKMRVKKLRQLLQARGLECKGCTEKREFVKLLADHGPPPDAAEETTNNQRDTAFENEDSHSRSATSGAKKNKAGGRAEKSQEPASDYSQFQPPPYPDYGGRAYGGQSPPYPDYGSRAYGGQSPPYPDYGSRAYGGQSPPYPGYDRRGSRHAGYNPEDYLNWRGGQNKANQKAYRFPNDVDLLAMKPRDLSAYHKALKREVKRVQKRIKEVKSDKAKAKAEAESYDYMGHDFDMPGFGSGERSPDVHGSPDVPPPAPKASSQSPGPSPQPSMTAAEILASDPKKMRLKKLRQVLAENNKDCVGCAEKGAFVDVFRKLQAELQDGNNAAATGGDAGDAAATGGDAGDAAATDDSDASASGNHRDSSGGSDEAATDFEEPSGGSGYSDAGFDYDKYDDYDLYGEKSAAKAKEEEEARLKAEAKANEKDDDIVGKNGETRLQRRERWAKEKEERQQRREQERLEAELEAEMAEYDEVIEI